MRQLRVEHEEDHDRDRSNVVARAVHPLSRFNEQDEEVRRLMGALQKAARARAASKLALEEINHDFDRNFMPGSGLRTAAEKLVIRSARVCANLEASSRSLEAAAVASVSMAQQGAYQREATIVSLQTEVRRGEAELAHAFSRLGQGQLHGDPELEAARAHATERVLAVDIRRAERHGEESDERLAKLLGEQQHADERRMLSAEEEHAKLIEHLQISAVRRLMKYGLAKGWTTWKEMHEDKRNLMKRSMARFRHHGMWSAIKRWITEYPPLNRVRRACEPLEAQIRALDRTLEQMREKYAAAMAKNEAAEKALKENSTTIERERSQRIKHLQQIGIRRAMNMDVARGFTSWLEQHKRDRALKYRALQRFRNVSLWSAFRKWLKLYPPIGNREDLEAELQKERVAHRRVRQMLTDRTRERDEARAQASESTRLQIVVRELQKVLAEAMMATSWTTCRQLLYYESLRYVPTAATHGKLLPASVRREINSVPIEGEPPELRPAMSGRLLGGKDLEHMLRDAPSMQELIDSEVRASDDHENAGRSAGTSADLAEMKRALRESEEAHARRVAEMKEEAEQFDQQQKLKPADKRPAFSDHAESLDSPACGGSRDSSPGNRRQGSRGGKQNTYNPFGSDEDDD